MKTNVQFIIIFLLLSIIAMPGCKKNNISYTGNGNKPDSLVHYNDLNLYSQQSPFNQLIAANASIDPESSMYISALVESAQPQDNFVISLKQFSTTVFIANDSTPRHRVFLPCGDYWQLGVNYLNDVPIPDFAEPTYDIDGENRPVKAGKCGEKSDQDNNMVILDLDNRCEYDFWQARKVNGAWEASWANSISMDGNGVYEYGLSTRGSGFAFLGGIIWPDELKNGVINHALVFNYSLTKSNGPVAPASESDGEVNRSDALPEGAHLRLDPALNLSSLNLSPSEMIIAKAMQDYGLYLCDNGGGGGNGSSGGTGIGLYAIDPKSVKINPYQGLLPDEDYPVLSHIPLDKLQVLTLPAQDELFQDKLKVLNTACAQFE